MFLICAIVYVSGHNFVAETMCRDLLVDPRSSFIRSMLSVAADECRLLSITRSQQERCAFLFQPSKKTNVQTMVDGVEVDPGYGRAR